MNRIKLYLERFDVIILLHSVFSNECLLAGNIFELIAKSQLPKAYFIGNEYKLMPEKMKFCDDLGINLLISQCSSKQVHDLYRERLRCEVAGIPNTGIDEHVFRPTTPRTERPIDLGYRAYDAPPYIGHIERRQIADYFHAVSAENGLSTDMSMKREDRLGSKDWAEFLNKCKGQLGTEAGTDFFELTDSTRLKVNQFVESNHEASWNDIFERFFRSYPNPVPLRIISGRHVEAAATKTVQILFEGRYDGYFQPGIHYIPLKKDFSNADEAIEKFKDEAYSANIAQNAYDLAIQEFIYSTLVGKLYDYLLPMV